MPTEEVAVPSGSDVLEFLSWPVDDALEAQANFHARQALAAVKSYVRGKGFSPAGLSCAPALAAVIVSYAARSLNNPTHDRRVEVGSFNSAPGSAASFSLTETQMLHAFRRTAA